MSKFKLIFCESATGIVLNSEGNRHLAGEPVPVVFFETERNAIRAAQEYMAQYEFAECSLVDLSTDEETRLPNSTTDV